MIRSVKPGSHAAINIEGKRITTTQLADALSFQLDRIVVVRAGLRNTFDIKVTWSPDPDSAEKSGDSEGASIFTVQEQPRLKLEAAVKP